MTDKIGIQLLKSGSREVHQELAELAALLAQLLEQVGELPGETPPEPTPEPPTPEPPSGDVIVVPEGSPSQEVSDAIKAEFPESQWKNAARVSYYESHWSNTAERNTLDRAGGRCNVPIGTLPDGTPIVSEQSIGLFQINRCAHGHDREYWQNTANNVKKAAELYRASGWHPWTVTARRIGLL